MPVEQEDNSSLTTSPFTAGHPEPYSRSARNIADQSAIFLEVLRTRNNRPAKPATLRAYDSYIRNHITPLIGNAELESFGNGAMKEFVKRLVAAKLGPKTIGEVVTLVKQIMASAVSQDGDQLYPRQWNRKFIDLPPRDRSRPPRMTDDQLAKALRSRHGGFYALLAGTGLRVAEALALRWSDTPNVTSLDSERPIIFVRSQIGLDREEYSPKTKAGEREIDLCPELWEFLRNVSNQVPGDFVIRNRRGGPMWPQTLWSSLASLGIPGFHAFRRHRITRLREIGVPSDIVRFWVGHEGEDIDDRFYSELAQNKELRTKWSQQAGLGFELPKLKPGPPAPQKTTELAEPAKPKKARRAAGLGAMQAPQIAEPAAPVSLTEAAVETYVGQDSDLPEIFFQVGGVS